jgi:uncharacterized protein DUF3179
VWSSALDGRVLTFHLVGINNQNFVMQDAETGTWWQQVSGEAILGPLKGKHLTLVPFDQLTFAAWRTETKGASTRGRVLAPDERIAAADRYAKADWEARMQKTPAPLSSSSDTRLAPRALIIGVEQHGEARAYRVEDVDAARVVLDDLGGTPIAIVRAPDGRSTRVFNRAIDGRPLELLAKLGTAATTPFRFIDATTGSEWDFTGTAVSGPLAGKRLARLPFLEEYWFDWKTYHPSTDIARHAS